MLGSPFPLRSAKWQIAVKWRLVRNIAGPAVRMPQDDQIASRLTEITQAGSKLPGAGVGVASKLALIGFVFSPLNGGSASIILSCTSTYVIKPLGKLASFFQTRITATKPVLLSPVFCILYSVF